MSEENGKVAVELTMEELYQAIGSCLMMEDFLKNRVGTFAHVQKAKEYKALAKKLDTHYSAQWCRNYEKTQVYLASYDSGKKEWKADVVEKTPPKPSAPLGKKAARA